jgi:hypothetical protein
MKQLRAIAMGAGIGALLGFGLVASGASAVLNPLALGLAVLCAAWWLYCARARRRAPERYRAYVAEHFDAEAGPPAGAEPVEEPVVARWFAAEAQEDSAATAALLAPDFHYVGPGRRRPLARRTYLRLVRVGPRWVGRTRTTLEQVLADPADPAVVWVRERSVTQPPRGGAEIRTGVWHRWTLTPDRERIRSFELVAFVEPLVHA